MTSDGAIQPRTSKVRAMSEMIPLLVGMNDGELSTETDI